MEDKKELDRLKRELTDVLSSLPDKKYQQDDKDSALYQRYSLCKIQGKAVYESFTDEELCAYLWNLAETLGHAPSQKEVFWVMRDYIKRRFDKWPYALKAAGLSSSAGKGGKSMERMEAERQEKEELLEAVRQKALELGKIPHPRDLPEICQALKKEYSTWSQIIGAAGLDAAWLNQKTVYEIPDLEPEYLAMLAAVKDYAYEIGRSPAHREIEPAVKQALTSRCGSWRNALYQIGLTPVLKIKPFNGIYIDHRKDDNPKGHSGGLKGCVYQVLNLSKEEKSALHSLEKTFRGTGSIPMKEDVEKELRKKLILKCGSWANVLYQIGISPKEYYLAAQKRQ